MLRYRLLASAAAAVLAMAACDMPQSGSVGSPVALGTFKADPSGSASYSMLPSLAFYRVTGAMFVNTSVASDSCLDAPYSDGTDAGPVVAPGISAGDYVLLSLGSRTDTLRRSMLGDPFYRTSGGQSIPFTPGDSMVIRVAGDPNGFPASTFRGRTAEALTVGAVNLPAPGDQMTVNWSPAGGSGAAVLVALRYASSDSVASFNRQVACTFVDDGTAAVPAPAVINWLRSSRRDMVVQRLRSILEQVAVPRSYFNVVSVFETQVSVP
ncbi:MAG: hypothetical protein IT356_08615 [Gemmatimonadaceae bacterium]|nr:hypothetical protein [Gemmatimonadaceae bacterium]